MIRCFQNVIQKYLKNIKYFSVIILYILINFEEKNNKNMIT